MHTDFERWEVLVKDQQRIGVRYQLLSAHVLLTRLLIDADPEPYRAESRIRMDPHTGNWEVNAFRNQLMEHTSISHRESGRFPTKSMPSFGEILMLKLALESPDEPLTYWHLDELLMDTSLADSTAHAEPNAMVRRVGEVQDLSIPQSAALRAQRFEAWVDGELKVTHWVDAANDVVCASWGEDVTAYRVPGTPTEAGWLSLAGLDESTVEFMARGFDA